MPSDAGDRVWVEDREWRLASPAEERLCRMPLCWRPARAAMKRRQGSAWRWWFYCEVHLYGRRIANGRVEEAVHPDSICAQRGWA